MKKFCIYLGLLALLFGCQTRMKYGQGGVNACQYVREKLAIQADNIKSVEVIGEDSLMDDELPSAEVLDLLRSGTDYLDYKISKKEYEDIINKYKRMVDDVASSWAYSFKNDSLRTIPEYDSSWHKVYEVEITMKSTRTKTIRVLMHNDGVTPRATEDEFLKIITDYDEKIRDAYDLLEY